MPMMPPPMMRRPMMRRQGGGGGGMMIVLIGVVLIIAVVAVFVFMESDDEKEEEKEKEEEEEEEEETPQSTFEPVDVATYRLYPDIEFVPSTDVDEAEYAVNMLAKEDGETMQVFADRCAEACNHETVDGMQCRVFKIHDNGQSCSYFDSTGELKSFDKNDVPGVHTYRHVGSTDDEACANYVADTLGDDWWGFRHNRNTPKSHFSWACRQENKPDGCDAAPESCSIQAEEA